MKRVVIDFGNSNTVVALYWPDEDRLETLELPGISRAVETPAIEGTPAATVHLIPTLVHYHEGGLWIGAQVVERDLLEHEQTWRWMKRRIALGVSKRRKTARGLVSAREAGAEFLTTVLTYLDPEIDRERDEFIFTAPVESFEDFEDWLREVAGSLGLARVRIQDEATACILGTRGTVRESDRALIFDFGCGTLDVAAVKVLPESESGRTAHPLGRAGLELGGLDIDAAIAEEFCREHDLAGTARSVVESRLLARAEDLKISLSHPEGSPAELVLETTRHGEPVTLVSRWDRARLEEILTKRGFLRGVRQTLDRALEEGALRSGLRRDAITTVVLTGGTSLVPCIQEMLEESFGERVRPERPFDAVVRGAGRGLVSPILQHDYAIESYNRERGEFEFRPLFARGTEYPTPAGGVKLWARGAHDGMTRIGIQIFEVSTVERRGLEVSLVDEAGALRDESRVRTDREHLCLNRDNPTFILADPPVNLERDARRFLCTFRIDERRRLCVTVDDRLAGRNLLTDRPVVQL